MSGISSNIGSHIIKTELTDSVYSLALSCQSIMQYIVASAGYGEYRVFAVDTKFTDIDIRVFPRLQVQRVLPAERI